MNSHLTSQNASFITGDETSIANQQNSFAKNQSMQRDNMGRFMTPHLISHLNSYQSATQIDIQEMGTHDKMININLKKINRYMGSQKRTTKSPFSPNKKKMSSIHSKNKKNAKQVLSKQYDLPKNMSQTYYSMSGHKNPGD